MNKTKMMVVALGTMLFAAIGACGGGSSSSSSSGTGTTTGTGSGTGGGTTGDCGANPFVCPAGQTCWIADSQGSKLECLNSGTAKAGESCKNFVGMPTCADGLICFQAQGENDGVCTPFCDPKDPAHACPNKGSCFIISFAPGDAKTHACAPETMGTGGGGGGTGGSGGSGGAGGN